MTPQEQHAQFSVDCFNETWSLLEKNDRTPDEDRLMREMAHASLFHWLKRDDCTPQNISIGLWQISRVHAVLGNGAQASHYAADGVTISTTSQLPAFCQAYAYEAVARAALLVGDQDRFQEALERATELTASVDDEGDRKLLETDLDELRPHGSN